jgi:hypothetical protein
MGLCGNPFGLPEKAISRGNRLCRRPSQPPRQERLPVVLWIMTRVRIWGNSGLSVGFRGCCLRVIDHEAVLLDPKLFSSLVPRLVVGFKRRFGRQTSSWWLSSRKIDWVVQVIPQHAIKAILVLSAYSKNGDRAVKVGMPLFTTALGLYGGVLCSGELRGPVIHDVMPTAYWHWQLAAGSQVACGMRRCQCHVPV